MNLDHVFVCGDPALDFAATLRARRSARFEMFAALDRLDAWYVQSGVVDAISPAGQDDVDRATAVREAVYRLVTARRLGEDCDGEALALVSSAARAPSAVPQLTASGRWTAATRGGAVRGRAARRRTAERA